jgi:hypothetical protein
MRLIERLKTAGQAIGGRPASIALVAVVLAGAAQGLTVRYNYGGNWTGLFCHGARQPLVPELSSERVFHSQVSALGYDGQFYHVMAHDPFLLRGYVRYVDAPRVRYQRILLPALAYLLGLGLPRLVDVAYIVLVLAFTGLGAGMLAYWARQHERAPVWGLLFLLVPATFVSLDRLTVDVALAALTAAALVLWRARRHAWLFLVVALAALSRETGLIVCAALVAAFAQERQWRRALLFATAALPALGWYGYVSALTPAAEYATSFVPFSGTWSAWLDALQRMKGPPRSNAGLHPLHVAWRVLAPLVAALRARLDLIGGVAAIASGFAGVLRVRAFPEIAAALFACLALLLQRADVWIEVYGFGRIMSPLLVILLMRGLARRSYWPVLVLIMMTPALIQQTLWQLGGILAGLLG